MHGMVDLQHSEGIGSSFVLRLPLTPSEASRPRLTARPPTTQINGIPSSIEVADPAEEITQEQAVLDINEAILVVDDALNRSLLSEMLASLKLTSIAVGTAQEALDLAMKQRFLAVIVDIHLPDFSGTELCAKILAADINRDTPIIGITGDHLPETTQACIDAGAVICLTKPIRLAELATPLRELELLQA